MTEEIINARKTIEKKQLKLRLEEMMTDSQKYDLLRAIYLLERLASYQTKNLEEKAVRKHIRTVFSHIVILKKHLFRIYIVY